MKLTESNYYTYESNKEFSSNSQIKDFQKCEFYAMNKLSPDYEDVPTVDMLVGQFVDEALTGNLEAWKEAHPEIIAKTGANKGMLKSEYRKAEQMVETCKSDKKFMQYLSGDKQVIMTGDLFGLPTKIKMDAYDSERKVIVDLKTTTDIYKPVWNSKTHAYQDFITAYGYVQQMAIYREIVFQNTGNKCKCFIAVVDKSETPNHEVIEIPEEEMDELIYGTEFNPGIIATCQRIFDLKHNIENPIHCGKCPDCIKAKKIIKPITLAELRGELS